ncbi:MAG: phenylalanine--tRNA ligase subunit beta [Salinisphaeraceae bacterium]
MKFNEQWLRSWVNPAVDTEELCQQLTMAGLEVDDTAPAGPALNNVVVGRIQAVSPHPDADKLSVCQVETGAAEPATIVCGAPNAAAGLVVPVALPGAALPNGLAVEAAEIRGVASAGMLCSAAELGLSDDAAGLMALDADAVIGTPLADHLALNDTVIDIDLTPNRGDCLSLRGIAREVGVWNRLPVTEPDIAEVAAGTDDTRPAVIDAEADCRVYAGRVIKGIDVAARTPDWMRERLRRAGIRPIFPVVDVTNYVLLELGQPMHAFDQQTLQGEVRVRRAANGETLTLLDDQDVTLDDRTLVIADADGPVAMAGVMGGARTAVGEGTVDVFLESACFTPSAVAGTGRRYKLHTDSLHRFERGVDPMLAPQALQRATALIQQIAGGQVGPVTLAGDARSNPASVTLRADRLARLLGTAVPDAEITDILERLGMQVEAGSEPGVWQVTPPSHRYDIALEADLIEEVARIHGYDHLPAEPRPVHAPITTQPESRRSVSRIRDVLCQRGYDEAISYSFVDRQLQDALGAGQGAIDLDNPIAAQHAQMRTTLWSSLLPCWQHNRRRQQHRVRLFEIGLRFERGDDEDIRQISTLAGLIDGPAEPEHWDGGTRAIDFFDVKGDIEALFGGRAEQLEWTPDQPAGLHPGRSATIRLDGKPVGHLGQLHPSLSKGLESKNLPYVFELDYEAIQQARVPRFESVGEYPEVRRDLALMVPDQQAVGGLLATIRQLDQPWLTAIRVFDVFRGGDLETGFKSVALGLIFQDKTSTLSREGVDEAVNRITETLNHDCGAQVRGHS